MKTFIKLLLVAVLATLMISCSPEEQRQSTPSIEGVWKIESISKNNVVQSINNCDQQTTLSLIGNQFNYQLTYRLNEECFTDVDNSSNKVFIYQDNVLTMTYTDNADNHQIDVAQVLSLTDNSLVLKIDFDDPSNINNQVLYFTKVQ